MAVTEKAQQLKSQLQAEVDQVNAQIALVDGVVADNAEEVQSAYNKGVTDGKASVVLPSPNDPTVQFTQADMDKLAAQAKAEQLAADQQAQADLQAKLDAQVKVSTDLQAQLTQAQADLKALQGAKVQSDAQLAKDEAEIAQVKAAVNPAPEDPAQQPPATTTT